LVKFRNLHKDFSYWVKKSELDEDDLKMIEKYKKRISRKKKKNKDEEKEDSPKFRKWKIPMSTGPVEWIQKGSQENPYNIE
jgi:hypothetical protein